MSRASHDDFLPDREPRRPVADALGFVVRNTVGVVASVLNRRRRRHRGVESDVEGPTETEAATESPEELTGSVGDRTDPEHPPEIVATTDERPPTPESGENTEAEVVGPAPTPETSDPHPGPDADTPTPSADPDASSEETEPSFRKPVIRSRRSREVPPAPDHARQTVPLTAVTVERSRPGAPWWRYRRSTGTFSAGEKLRHPAGGAVKQSASRRPEHDVPPAPVLPVDDGGGSNGRGSRGGGNGGGSADGVGGGASDPIEESSAPRSGITGAQSPPSGVVYGVLAGLALGLALIGGRLGVPVIGRLLIPVAAVLGVVAFGKRAARVHPDEPWLARFLLWGVLFKIAASALRYWVLVGGFEGVGDAADYDKFGRRYSLAWFGDGPYPSLDDLRETNFVRWFTGVVYETFGPDMLMGFIVFGLLAFIGTYLWYRGTVKAVPTVNKRLYLGLILFAPSIAFWPSSIGKESLMQLGFGFVALGAANLLQHRILRGLLIAAPGGWLLWVVRPHLLAMATIAVGVAFLFGRRKVPTDEPRKFSLTRPIGILVLALLVSFAVSAGADGLGMEELSLAGIQQELDETTAQTSQGGSKFESGENSLSPLTLPEGAATVLLRPFPWEVESGFQILASIESAALAIFIIYRRRSLWQSLTHARDMPFLLYCWTLTLIYAAAFSSFANFGLLTRQRSLVFPALFVLLSLDAVRTRRSADPPAVEGRSEKRPETGHVVA